MVQKLQKQLREAAVRPDLQEITDVLNKEHGPVLREVKARLQELLAFVPGASGAQTPVRAFDVTNPDFGGSPTADAATNDAAFAAAAAAAAAAGGGVLWIPDGTFEKLQGLELSAGVTIDGTGTVSFSGVTQTTIAFAWRGTEGTGVPLNSTASEGGYDLDVSGSGFVTDEWVKIYSEAVTGSTNWKQGEIGRLSSAAAMQLYDPLCATYQTTDAASVAPLNLLAGVGASNIRIVGPADNSVTFSGFLADRTLRPRFVNVTCERCHFYGIGIQDSVGHLVLGCHFSRSETGALAYGLAIFNATQDGVQSNLRGYRLRHLVTHGGFTTRHGVPRRSVTSNSVASQARNSGFDAHASGEDISFDNCTVLGSESDGFTIECVSAALTNCVVRDSVGPAFHLNPQSIKPFRVSLANCQVSGKGNAATRSAVQIQVSAGYESFDGIAIVGLNAADCRYWLRTINAQTGRIENLSISGGVAKQCGLDGDAVVQVVHAHNVAITGMAINDTTNSVDGISLTDVTHFSVGHNSIQLTGTGGCRGVRCLTTCDDGTIGGNEVDTGASGIGIGFADTCTNITIGSDNHLRGCPTPYSLGTGSGHTLNQQPLTSADRGDNDIVLTHSSEQCQRFNTPLTGQADITLPSANVKMDFIIAREAGATGTFNVNVGGLLNLPDVGGSSCRVRSDGTAYRVVQWP